MAGSRAFVSARGGTGAAAKERARRGGARARATRREAAIALTLAGATGAGEREARAEASCSCPPESAPCPTTSNGLIERLPDGLVAWSAVTGTCLPWGPLGPLGVIGSAALFRRAALLTPAKRKDLSAVETRRRQEVEKGLRDLDALAKRNAPYVGAVAVLLLSVPRTLGGAALAGFTAIAGVALAALAPTTTQE